MAEEFYLSFKTVPYPCYWLGTDGKFWMNDTVLKTQDTLPKKEDIYKQMAVFARILHNQPELGVQTMPLLTDALRMQGLVVLPHAQGILAAAQGNDTSPVLEFSSHLRRPISNILYALPPLSAKLDDDGMQSVESIQQSGYELLRYIENLEIAGKIEKGKFNTEVFDLSELTQSIYDGVNSIARGQKVPIKIKLSGLPVPVRADKKILGTAILNAVRNSIQYTRDGNEIHISLNEKNHRAILTIEDKGLGIKPENLTRIFEPYFSADPYGDTQECPSVGLGLAVAQEAARKFGGTITAESRFGEGTRMVLALPVADVLEGVLDSDPVNYVSDVFSSLYVQLSGYCDLPGLTSKY